MRYLLLIHDTEARLAALSPEDRKSATDSWWAYDAAIKEEGLFRAGAALLPTDTATTVRVRDGETLVSDGPFAETKEQLGGFYEIECETLDQAIDAAARMPHMAHGSVEIRPRMDFEL